MSTDDVAQEVAKLEATAAQLEATLREAQDRARAPFVRKRAALERERAQVLQELSATSQQIEQLERDLLQTSFRGGAVLFMRRLPWIFLLAGVASLAIERQRIAIATALAAFAAVGFAAGRLGRRR